MKKTIVIGKRADLIEYVFEQRKANRSIGLVPTMGALHQGHLSLMEKSVGENDITIASIFVNPKQFGPKEDFSCYPRTFSEDVNLANQAQVDVIFAPTIREIYPEGFCTNVSVNELSNVLCGSYRPGHFDGVCTIVLFLLNIVGPDRAYFGMKDFQQLQIIRRMTEDLAHKTQIIPCPTLREPDGLAMSSRNRYLTPESRELASAFPRALAKAAKLYLDGERNPSTLITVAKDLLAQTQIEPQYLEVRALPNLIQINDNIDEKGAVMAAALIVPSSNGTCRLIDNIVLTDDSFHRTILENLLKITQ